MDKDICSPICRTGCNRGRCIAPETCHCDPPSILDPSHTNTCIQKKCDLPCVNADCVDDICRCHKDFTKYNTTHCLKCDSGYSLNDEFDCLPICNNPCINGKCTAPDTCTCLDGYIQNNLACDPICNCINAKCVAPYKCACFEGYIHANDSACVPKCDCDGECVEPNVCKSKSSNVNATCMPNCEICDRGVCVKHGPDPGVVRNRTGSDLNNMCKKKET